jgi:choline-phosphate cytidylyltransferase
MILKPRKKSINTKIRIYIDGVFDLFHHGHANAIKQAKESFKNCEVIVGLNTDEDTMFYKGKPVLNERERLMQIEACKYVDKVIYPAPWYPSQQFIIDHKIDFVAHDEIPYGTDEIDDIYLEAKMAGKFLRTFRTPEISTSELIQRVIRDREQYIMSLKKRGFSLNDMKVSKVYYVSILFTHYLGLLAKVVCFCKKKEKEKRYKRKSEGKGVVYTCKMD